MDNVHLKYKLCCGLLGSSLLERVIERLYMVNGMKILLNIYIYINVFIVSNVFRGFQFVPE